MARTLKFNTIYAIALGLIAEGRTLNFDELAARLNLAGFKTSYGTAYQGARGVAKLVAAVYAYVHNELGLGDTGAAPVAEAFTKQNGEFAYD